MAPLMLWRGWRVPQLLSCPGSKLCSRWAALAAVHSSRSVGCRLSLSFALAPALLRIIHQVLLSRLSVQTSPTHSTTDHRSTAPVATS